MADDELDVSKGTRKTVDRDRIVEKESNVPLLCIAHQLLISMLVP